MGEPVTAERDAELRKFAPNPNEALRQWSRPAPPHEDRRAERPRGLRRFGDGPTSMRAADGSGCVPNRRHARTEEAIP